MAKQTINNGETGLTTRGKINDNFTELYARDIYVEDYGAVGDGSTDDTIVINAAITAAIASTSSHVVRLKAKNYRITGPLLCYKLSAGAYTIFNVSLIGDGNANAGVTNQCTKIIAAHTDTFAIGFQNARSGTIENILIQGGFTASKSSKQIFEGDITDWVQSGVRDTQFSPYAGIVVDPFGSSVPADGGYPGLSSFYKASAAGSSGVTIRSCTITNFAVDFLISPNGTTSNAESINVYNCRLYNSKVAWASGQSQTRNCVLRDSAIFYALDAINTISYGAGTGSSAVIDSLIISKARNCVNVSTSRGAIDISNLYAEEIWKIGVVSGAKMVSFKGVCTFKFNFGENSDGDILAPDTLLSGGGVCYFDKADFTKPGDANWNASFRNQTSYINGGILDCNNIPFGTLTIENAAVYGFDVATKERLTGATPSPFYNYHGSRARKLGITNTTFLEHHIRANGNSAVILEVGVTLTVSDNEATFDLASTSKVKVGDMVYTDKSGFYFLDYTNSNSTTANADLTPYLGTVKSIVGSTVTIKDLRFQVTSGTYNVYAQWSDKYTGGIVGTTTNNSNVITNVYKESSTSLVGYRIYAADPALFPYRLYVVSEDTNARTLTLSGNLNASISAIFLYTTFFTMDCITSVDPTTLTNLYVEKGQIIRSKSQTLTDKIYLVTAAGIVGNGTHTPAFKTVTVA